MIREEIKISKHVSSGPRGLRVESEIYIYTLFFSRGHPLKIVALRSVYYFTASKISRDVFCDSFKWHLGEKVNRALQISEKKEEENESAGKLGYRYNLPMQK